MLHCLPLAAALRRFLFGLLAILCFEWRSGALALKCTRTRISRGRKFAATSLSPLSWQWNVSLHSAV